MREEHFDSEYLEIMRNVLEYKKHRLTKENKSQEIDNYEEKFLNMDVVEFTYLDKENIFCKSEVSYRGKLRQRKYDCLIDDKILSFIRIINNYKGLKLKGILQLDEYNDYLLFDSNTLDNEENIELRKMVNKILGYLDRKNKSYIKSKR